MVLAGLGDLVIALGGCGGSDVPGSGSSAQRTAFRAWSLRNFLTVIGFSGSVDLILLPSVLV
jgi:hypothetical protein